MDLFHPAMFVLMSEVFFKSPFYISTFREYPLLQDWCSSFLVEELLSKWQETGVIKVDAVSKELMTLGGLKTILFMFNSKLFFVSMSWNY